MNTIYLKLELKYRSCISDLRQQKIQIQSRENRLMSKGPFTERSKKIEISNPTLIHNNRLSL